MAGNVAVMDARLRVTGRQQFVRAAVAIDTSGGFRIAPLDRLAVEAAIVCTLLVSVTGRA